MADPLVELTQSIMARLRTNTYIAIATNVTLGESKLLEDDICDEEFPRIEVSPRIDDYIGYDSQRYLSEMPAFTINGYIRRENDVESEDDIYDMMEFAIEARKSLYQFNNDKALGSPPCTGFDAVHDYSTLDINYGIFERITYFELSIAFKMALTLGRS